MDLESVFASGFGDYIPQKNSQPINGAIFDFTVVSQVKNYASSRSDISR